MLCCGILLFTLYIRFSIFMRLEISAAKVAIEVRETFFCAVAIDKLLLSTNFCYGEIVAIDKLLL